jgi:glycosyltransferase involved in cell wall biosynthesis
MDDLAAIHRLRRYMEDRRIDVVHTHSSKAGILGRLAAHLARVPLVIHTVHGWSFNDTQPPALRSVYAQLERSIAPLTDRVITVSSQNRETGLARGIGESEQYAVIRSGIEIGDWDRPRRDRAAVRTELGFDPHHRVVGTVSCLKSQKAPLDFVRVAAAASSRNPDLRFFIAGDGELRAETAREIERLGLQEVVRLLGWRRDVVDLLHAMDVFLLTSRYEGLPRSVLQAVASGTPVVASAVDGTPEVIRHGQTGMLFQPGRIDEAAECLARLLDDDALAAGCADRARSRLTEEFEIGEMVRRLDRLYLDRLDARQGSSIHSS